MKSSPVLGPIPCLTCGLLVVYDGLEWRTASGVRRHVCRSSIVKQNREARRIAARRLVLAANGETIP